MPSVDKRIVEMRFDNKDFESNVSESISSLDRLKSSLKLGEAARGFDEIGEAADAVTRKFSILGTIGDQILRNIGNEVYQLKNQFVGLVKSMSVDQITAGMKKYEDKTSSVQTIINATGESIEDVNEQLERLMRYSDETSFDFTDMTQALQTMTASGGKLEDLVPMLMGIGNATAFAGKSAGEFSRVMYNLNQAYSLGYLGTQDWKSVQMAGVGSKQLKQALLDSARALGTGDYGFEEFSTALTKKVFTTEVMEDAFGKFAKATLEAERLVEAGVYTEFSDAYDAIQEQYTKLGDDYDQLAYSAARAAQEAKSFTEAIDATKDAVSSGWMTTFEKIFGNYEEAKELWTWVTGELWEVFAEGAKDRNDMLETWHKKGGYEEFWKSVQNIWYGLKGIGGRIKAAWEEIFPSLTVEKLLNATHKFHEWSEKFVVIFGPVENAIEGVSAGAEKLRGFIDPALAIFHTEEAEEFVETLDSASDSVTRLANTIRDLDILTSKVWAGDYGVGWDRWNQLEEEGYNWQLVQNEVNAQADCAHRFEIAQEDLDAATRLLNGDLEETADNSEDVSDAMDEMSDAVEKSRSWLLDLRDVVGGVKSAFDLLIEAGKLVAKYILIPAWNFLVDVFKKGLAAIAPFSRAFTDFVNRLKESGAITRNIENFRAWFRDLIETAKNSENVQRLLEHFDRFKTWIGSIKEKSLNRITEFFDKIVNLDIDFSKWDMTKVVGWIDTAAEWINKGLDKLKDVEKFWPKIKAFFEGLDFSGVQSFAESAASGISTFFQTLFADKDLKEASKGWFDQIWAGLKEKIKEIDWGEIIDLLIKSLGGAMVLKFVNSLSNLFGAGADLVDTFSERIAGLFSGITKAINATALLAISLAILTLAAAMLVLSKIPTDKLSEVTVDIVVVMGMLAVIAAQISKLKIGNRMNNVKVNVFSQFGTILVGLGIALASLALVAKVVKNLTPKQIWTTLGIILALLAMMAAFALAIKTISKIGDPEKDGNNLVKAALAFGIIAVAIDLMLPTILALALVAKWDPKMLWNSVAAIALILGMVAVIAVAAKTKDGQESNIIRAAIAFAIFAVAIDILTPALLALSAMAGMNWQGYIIVMLSIVALLAVFAVVVKVLGSLENNGGIKGAAAMTSIALAILSMGVALKALSSVPWKDLLIAAGVMAALAAIFALLGFWAANVQGMSVALLALGAALFLFGSAILLAGVGALAFAAALKLLSNASLDASKAGKNLAQGMIAFFDELVKNGESIIKFIKMVIEAVLAILIMKKANIVETGASIVTAFGDKLVKLIQGSKGKIIVVLAVVLAAVMDFLGVNVGTLIDYIVLLIIKIINGISRALVSNAGQIWAAIGNLIAALFNLLMKGISMMLGWLADLLYEWFGLSTEWADNIAAYWEDQGDQIIAAIDSNDAAITDQMQKDKQEMLNSASEYKRAMEESAGLVNDGHNQLERAILAAQEGDVITYNGYEYSGEALSRLQQMIASGEVQIEMSSGGEDAAGNYLEGFLGKIRGSYDETAGGMQDWTGIVNDETMAGLGEASPSKISEEYGEYYVAGFGNGIDHSIGSLRPKIKKLVTSINNEFKSIKTMAIQIGRDFDEGFANGINMYSYIIEKAAENAGRKAVAGAKKGTDAHSPSNEGRKIGHFFDQGFALGIEEDGSLIFNAAEGVGSGAIAAIQDVISRISAAMDNDWNMNPVIRPVLDLSEIQNGQARIGSVLGYGGYAFSPNLGYGMERAFGVQTALTGYLERDSSAYGSVGMMQTQIAELTEQNQTMMGLMKQYLPYIPELANMQVVTDRGTLVGELAPMMNDRLGKIAAKSRR